MGVHATFCQLCGLPVQHDHYVPSAEGTMFKIYRGKQGADGGHTWEAGERPFPFTSSHGWLLDAVAVGLGDEVVAGRVEDGGIGDDDSGFLGSGDEDGYALHRFCWEAMGSPKSPFEVKRTPGTHAWALLSRYQGQLFEFAALVEDGKGWMLEDPRTSERSRARITAMLEGWRPFTASPTDVPSVLASDLDWDARGVARFRSSLQQGVDPAGYETLIEVKKPRVPGDALEALEALERELKRSVETGAAAVLLVACFEAEFASWLLAAKEVDVTLARLSALDGGALATVVEADPGWKSLLGG